MLFGWSCHDIILFIFVPPSSAFEWTRSLLRYGKKEVARGRPRERKGGKERRTMRACKPPSHQLPCVAIKFSSAANHIFLLFLNMIIHSTRSPPHGRNEKFGRNPGLQTWVSFGGSGRGCRGKTQVRMEKLQGGRRELPKPLSSRQKWGFLQMWGACMGGPSSFRKSREVQSRKG